MVVLNLRPLVVQLGDRVAIFGRVAERLPADAGRIEIMQADQLETAQDVTQFLKILGQFLWIVPLLLAALAIWLAGGRRRSIVRVARHRSDRRGHARPRRCAASPATTSSTTSSRPSPCGPPRARPGRSSPTLLRDGGRTLVGLGLVLLLGVWLVGPGAEGGCDPTAAWRRGSSGRRSPTAPPRSLLALLVWWGPTAQVRRWQLVLAFAVHAGLRCRRPDQGGAGGRSACRLPLRARASGDRSERRSDGDLTRDAGAATG